MEQLSEAREKEVSICFQWDNATPHIDKVLTTYLEREFDKRGWFLAPQLSNSPITNINNAYFFPVLAKRDTEAQGLENGIAYLQGEQLWSTVEKVWQEYLVVTLARSYVHYHQHHPPG